MIKPPSKKPVAKITPLQQKFATLREELNLALLEKSEEIDLTLTAVVAQTSVMFIGPPGCAKSMVIRCISKQIKECIYFEYQMHKQTELGEILGGWDLLKLKEGIYARRRKGKKLPQAHFVYFDEIWNAGPSSINALNLAMNEREFDNGEEREKLNLIAMFASANRHPQEGELNAAYDRWVLRANVHYTEYPSSRKKLLSKVDHTPKLTVNFTLSELQNAAKEALNLNYPERSLDLSCKIVEDIIANGAWQPSDRRLPLTGRIVRAYAYICGDVEVQPKHLEILKYVLWNSPGEQEEKCEKIVVKWANPIGHMINQKWREALSIVKQANGVATVETTTKLEEIQQQLTALGEEDVRVQGKLAELQELIDDNNKKLAGIR